MTEQTITDTYGQTVRIPVDPEPTSLRLALIGTLIAGGTVGYVLTLLAFPQATCSPMALIVGVILGAICMQIAEYYLKPRWPVSRFLELSPTQLNILHKEDKTQVIDPEGGEIEMYMWRFEVTRAGRVPKGFYMVAMAVERDDIFLPVYSLMSPDAFQALPYNRQFGELASRDELKRARDDAMRLAGKQRRLLRAESAREIHGVEMLPDDFVRYLDWIKMHFPEWLPTAQL